MKPESPACFYSWEAGSLEQVISPVHPLPGSKLGAVDRGTASVRLVFGICRTLGEACNCWISPASLVAGHGSVFL